MSNIKLSTEEEDRLLKSLGLYSDPRQTGGRFFGGNVENVKAVVADIKRVAHEAASTPVGTGHRMTGERASQLSADIQEKAFGPRGTAPHVNVQPVLKSGELGDDWVVRVSWQTMWVELQQGPSDGPIDDASCDMHVMDFRDPNVGWHSVYVAYQAVRHTEEVAFRRGLQIALVRINKANSTAVLGK